MTTEQGALFDKRRYRGALPQGYAIDPPTPDMPVSATLPAYYAYLSSGGYSQYTPDDFLADLKRFSGFTGTKPLHDIKTVDIQQWIGELKRTMPDKTVSRKVSAMGNYFKWLTAEKVLEKNPAANIKARWVASPDPDILFNNECDKLLVTASADPRTYLLVLLLLETGLKKAELLDLGVGDFDFSNKYQPEVQLRHTGKQKMKDRKLKLPVQVIPVFTDYLQKYGATGALFPYSNRFIEQLLTETAREAGLSKKVTPGILRDMFVVRGIKQGEKMETLFEKIGLSKDSYDYARKRYARLAREAL